VSDLLQLLEAAARGSPPHVDGLVELYPRPAGVRAAILGFTGHHVIAADVDPGWVTDRLRPWDLNAPFGAAFIAALEAQVGGHANTQDIVLVAPKRPQRIDLRPVTGAVAQAAIGESPHPRAGTLVWRTGNGDGTLVLGRGLAHRWELRFDVDPAARGRGLGRALAGAAPGLVPTGELVFAQVAPGNVASLRAILAAGYKPIGAEVLLFDTP
jgi:GNAT superfamily N-acetyltransferase